MKTSLRKPPRKQSGPDASGTAAFVLGMKPLPEDDTVAAGQYNVLLADAKQLAGSVLSQDETRGQGPALRDEGDSL